MDSLAALLHSRVCLRLHHLHARRISHSALSVPHFRDILLKYVGKARAMLRDDSRINDILEHFPDEPIIGPLFFSIIKNTACSNFRQRANDP